MFHSFQCIFIPNKLLSGGVGGIGIIIHYLTGIPTGVSVFLLNIPIFIIGSKLDRNLPYLALYLC